MVKVNEEYIVTIEDLGASGDGVAKINDFIVFVKGAKIGEKLRIRISYVKPTFAFGERID